MFKATFRSFLAHKGRMALSAIAVLLSVAFVSGTLIFTDTITKTFDDLFKSTAADVTVSQKSEQSDSDLAVTGQVKSIPVGTTDQVAKMPGVKAAHAAVSVENITVVDSKNKSVGPDGGAPTIGLNWYESDRSPVKITSGRVPQAAGEAVVDADTADRKKIKIGDSLRVIAAPGTTEVKVVGVATFTTTNPGATLVFLETAAAQKAFLGSTDKISDVELDAAPGVTHEQLKQTVSSQLGAGFEVKTKAEAAKDASDDIGTFINFMKYAMLGFAGVAVLVGIFLIFNTFQMLVAQRTRELGLMRAVGASGKQVKRSVVVEALLLGVVGSTLGLAAGFGLAIGLKALIQSFGMNLKGTSLVFNPATPIAAYSVGIIVTVLAAYIPARRAARISPMAALREASAPVQKPLRRRTVIGIVIAAIGVFGLVAAATASSAKNGGFMLVIGILMTLVSFVVLGPVLARTVIPWLGAGFPKLFGPMGKLSRDNSMRNPRRTGATAAALMIGVALVSGIAVFASSMNSSLSKQIDRSFGADFTVQGNSGGPMGPDIYQTVKGAEGVGTPVRARLLPDVEVTYPDGQTSKDQVNAVDKGFDSVWKLKYTAGDASQVGTPGSIVLDEQAAKDHGVGVGGTVKVTFPGGKSVDAKVVALREHVKGGLQFGFGNIPTLPISTLEEVAPDVQDFLIFANAAPGADKSAVSEKLEATLDPFPQVSVRDQADYKELVQGQIKVLLYMIYGLLGLAIIIAILGVINTLALSVVERTREIGLMRAIGASRRQIRRMIRLESIVIAVFGALVGLVLGLSWGVTAQRLLSEQGLEVLTIPWGTVVTVVIASAVVGLLAALLPALRASRMNVLAAIASE
ncbi:ABC transporter permease [Yinghuangia soli]|uniref:ABC transporter permease n=1 Tax=Yinghuangia soli TaxID=2908204 RepID=A0AA41Q5B1_9ACTN|nr:FtsX-like permease family protein [Yinghuangia soli]MCF2531850.1 ABC transporter permease [Yinghuangia soli]